MFLEKSTLGKNGWYLYFFGILFVFLATQIGGIPLAVMLAKSGTVTGINQSLEAVTTTNAGMAAMLLSFVVGFFALWLWFRVQKKSFSNVATGRPRFDWKRFAFAFIVWSIITLGWNFGSMLIKGGDNIVFNFDPKAFFPMFAILIVLLPFQTGFEELMFRGYLMQGNALLFKNRWLPLVITSLIFGLLHSANSEIGMYGFWVAIPQYILMGLIMGIITLWDDGLELAWGLHFGNNLMGTAIFSSAGGTLSSVSLWTDTAPTTSYWDTVLLLILGALFIYICNLKFKFWGKHRLSSPIDFVANTYDNPFAETKTDY